MSPAPRSISPMVTLRPRFGTQCHISWLLFDMSIGFTTKKLAIYSTMPLALRGAS